MLFLTSPMAFTGVHTHYFGFTKPNALTLRTWVLPGIQSRKCFTNQSKITFFSDDSQLPFGMIRGFQICPNVNRAWTMSSAVPLLVRNHKFPLHRVGQ